MLIELVTFLLFLIIPQQIAICFNLIPWIPVILLLPERVSHLSSTYNLLAKGFNGMTNFSIKNSGIMLASLPQLSVLKQWTQPLASFQLNSISRFGWKEALTQDIALNGQRYTAVLWRFFQSSNSKSSLSENKLKIRSFRKHTPLSLPTWHFYHPLSLSSENFPLLPFSLSLSTFNSSPQFQQSRYIAYFSLAKWRFSSLLEILKMKTEKKWQVLSDCLNYYK